MSYSVLSIETSAGFASREYSKKATRVCTLRPLTALIQTRGLWWLRGDSRDKYCDWTAERTPHTIGIDTSTLRGWGWGWEVEEWFEGGELRKEGGRGEERKEGGEREGGDGEGRERGGGRREEMRKGS